MDLNITDKKEQPLLSRKKVVGDLSFSGATPSYDDVKKSISSSLKCDEKLVIITNVYTKFGLKKATFSAYVYDNEKDMKNIEKIKEEEKPKEGEAAAATEEKKEEAPAPAKEDKAEAKPEEKKAE